MLRKSFLIVFCSIKSYPPKLYFWYEAEAEAEKFEMDFFSVDRDLKVLFWIHKSVKPL